MATVFVEFDMDSAEHYAKNSIKLTSPDESVSIHAFNNYCVLGTIYHHRKDYHNALLNYLEAEQIGEKMNVSTNMDQLYEKIIESCEELNDKEKVEKYRQKWLSNRLHVEQSKNKSLHRIIENSTIEQRKNSKILIGISAALVLILLVLLLLYVKKNRKLVHLEKASQQYLKELQKLPQIYEQSHKELLEMVRNNDPRFLATFHKVYPGFSKRLEEISNSMAETEIEFCALLKLNIPTKEIALYKNIEPKSVQNKKYRIRKKLNIPDNQDIYYWFNSL